MSLFTAEELMTQTLGLAVEEVQTHPMANFPNLAKHPDSAQYAILQRMIDRGYGDFTGKVARAEVWNWITSFHCVAVASGRVKMQLTMPWQITKAE